MTLVFLSFQMDPIRDPSWFQSMEVAFSTPLIENTSEDFSKFQILTVSSPEAEATMNSAEGLKLTKLT
jgi:hypothetical protein